jgi:DNA-directed RNA polymerase subunit P
MGVKYKCGRCGQIFDISEVVQTYGTRIRCPYCGYEVIYKVARSYRIVRAI